MKEKALERPPFCVAEHGGADALGAVLHDFSSNGNACGPCPQALQAVQAADPGHYPDPAYTALRRRLGAFHGVEPWRVVVAASASEFIHRITAWAQLTGLHAAEVPQRAYGDYGQAAQARRMRLVQRSGRSGTGAVAAALQWACEPSSPFGQVDEALAAWQGESGRAALLRICDGAYLPLRLDMPQAGDWLRRSRELQAHCWQLFSPNKALGMTGVRGAYAIAPTPQGEADAAVQQAVCHVQALAPSWPVGTQSEAMLLAWTDAAVQDWLADSRRVLATWKPSLIGLCGALGWRVAANSLANYLVADTGCSDLSGVGGSLRHQGIKVRDCASFGLPGHVRVSVRPPVAQQALCSAWQRSGSVLCEAS